MPVLRYSLDEAHAMLGTSKDGLIALAKSGRLPAVQNAFTGEWEFERGSIDWLQGNMRREMTGKAR